MESPLKVQALNGIRHKHWLEVMVDGVTAGLCLGHHLALVGGDEVYWLAICSSLHGHFAAFYVISVPLEFIPTIPPHSTS